LKLKNVHYVYTDNGKVEGSSEEEMKLIKVSETNIELELEPEPEW
jgi:hypothetical protein